MYAPVCKRGIVVGSLLLLAGCGVGTPCGGIQGLPCADGLYCAFETGECGAADQLGVCMPIPEACTEEFAPVCGCDGETYSNDCFASAAGISIECAGECPCPGE